MKRKKKTEKKKKKKKTQKKKAETMKKAFVFATDAQSHSVRYYVFFATQRRELKNNSVFDDKEIVIFDFPRVLLLMSVREIFVFSPTP